MKTKQKKFINFKFEIYVSNFINKYYLFKKNKFIKKKRAPGGGRTHDLWLIRPML